MTKKPFALICLLLSSCATTALEPTPFSDFAGPWRGTGTFQGLPSVVEARFAPLQGGGVWELDINIVATPPSGAPVNFAGHAEYTMTDGAPTGGNWTDNQGSAYALAPRFENGALVVDWGDGAAVRGRSEYRLQDDGDLQIDDFAPSRGGEMRRFATAELQRR
jgi:hypothetical protein